MARDNADYVFYATLDSTKAEAALERIEAKAEKIAEKLASHFNNLNGALDSAFKVDTKGIDALKGKLAGINVDALLAQVALLESRLQAIGDIPPIKLTGAISPTSPVTPISTVAATPTTTGTTPPPVITPVNITETSAAVDTLDQRLKQLTATELVTIATGDRFTQTLIKQAQAGGTTAAEFGQIVTSTGQVSQTQLALATAIAQSKLRLEGLNASLRESGVDRETVIAAIKSEQQALIANEAAIEKAAATAQQAAAEKLAAAEQVAAAEAETNKRLREDIAKREALEKAAAVEAKKVAAARNTQLEQTKRILAANVRSVTDVRNAFATLAAQSGQVVVKFNALESELTEQDKRVLKLIQSNKQLSQVYNNLAGSVGRADIAFDNLDFPITKMRQLGDETDKVSRKVGGLGEAVKFKLISAFENLARTGVDAFRKLATEASRTAEEFFITQRAFENILGDPDAAIATFNLIRQESEKFGVDITGIVGQLLPRLTDPAAQIPLIAEVSRGLLSTSQAVLQGKTLNDVAFSLLEAFSGDYISLIRRFGVPADIAQAVKADVLKGDLTEALAVLTDYLELQGIVGDAVNDTLTQSRNQIKAIFTTIKGEIGVPINESQLEFFITFRDFILENREPILEFALLLGEAFSNLFQIITAPFLDNLQEVDMEDVKNTMIEFNIVLFEILENMRQTDWKQMWEDLRGFGDAFQVLLGLTNPAIGLTAVIQDFDGSMNKLLGTLGLVPDIANKVITALEWIAKFFNIETTFFDDWREGLGLVVEKFKDLLDTLGILDESMEEVSDGSDRFKLRFFEAIRTVRGALFELAAVFVNLDNLITGNLTLEQYKANVQAAGAEGRAFLEAETQAVLAQYDAQTEAVSDYRAELEALLATRAAARNIEEPIIAAQSAGAVSDEALQTAEDVLRKRLELEKKYIDKELDIEIDAQRKRVEIWDDYYRKLQDLDTDFFRALEDAALDYERDQADLATDIADKQADIERESAKKRLDIETDYLRKLEDLRRKFQFDASEAIRANDAIRFLQLKRQLEFDRRSAAIERDRKLEDQAETESDKLEDLKRDEARKRAELKLEYERELEDIRIKDAQKRQDAILARQRALEDLLQWEADKRADLLTEYERELAEFGVFQKEKEEGTTAALAELQKLVEAGNQALADTESEFYKTRIANFERFVAQYQRTAAGLQVAQGAGLEGGEQSEIQRLRAQALMAARNSSRPDLIGQIISAKTIAELRAILEQLGITTGASGSSGGGTQGQQQIRNLQAQARRLASTKGVLAEWEAIIASANRVAALQRIIRDIDEGKPPTPRAKGGPVYPNRTYMVGEAGPEILTMGRFGGHVTPMMDGRNFSLGMGGGASMSSITNNTFQNNFSMLDPNSMSAGQIAIMQQVMGEVLMRVANRL